MMVRMLRTIAVVIAVVALPIAIAACGSVSQSAVVQPSATQSSEPDYATEEPVEENPFWVSKHSGLSKAEYKRACRRIEFRVLDKRADQLVGRLYTFTAKILEIEEAPTGQYFTAFGDEYQPRTFFRADTTRGEYDIWDNTVMFMADGVVSAYTDDVVTVWGECRGSFTYESQAGWNIKLPLVWARYVQKAK